MQVNPDNSWAMSALTFLLLKSGAHHLEPPSPIYPWVNLARIFLFLEQLAPQASLNSKESILYSALYCFVLSCVVLCRIVLYCTVWHIVRANLKAPQFLKIESYTQRLSHRVCMGDGGSGWWAPVEIEYTATTKIVKLWASRSHGVMTVVCWIYTTAITPQ